MTNLRGHVTGLELARRRLLGRGQQVSHGVVELGQVHADPGSEEDDVAHQGLVLESGPEGPVLAVVNAWPQSLKKQKNSNVSQQHSLVVHATEPEKKKTNSHISQQHSPGCCARLASEPEEEEGEEEQRCQSAAQSWLLCTPGLRA